MKRVRTQQPLDRQLRERLKELGEIEEPARNLWPDIRNSIRSKQLAWTRLSIPRFVFVGGAAVMAVGLILGLLFGVILTRPAMTVHTAFGTYPSDGGAVNLRRLVSLEEEYQRLKLIALDAARQIGAGLPSGVLANIESDLAELDVIANRVLSTLGRHGGSPEQYKLVYDHYLDKFEVLSELRRAWKVSM